MKQNSDTKPGMAECRISSAAEDDLTGIADYTIKTFGIKQARRYKDRLESCFQALANNPFLGQSADELVPRLRFVELQSHTIFYLPQEKSVLVVRVLHASMNAARHLGGTNS